MKRFLSILRRKRTILFVLFFLFAFLIFCKCFSSCQMFSADSAFERFTEELFRQELASNTISLHYTLANPSQYDLESSPVTLGGYTSDADALSSNLDTYLTALEKFSEFTLSDKNQLTYDILHSYLMTSKEGLQYLLYEEPLSPVTGIHAQLPILFSEYQFYTKEDVTTYLKLLGETGEYFDSIVAFEQEKANVGLFMPDYQLEEVIDYCRSFVQMGEENYLYSSFEDRLNSLTTLTTDERNTFCNENALLMEQTIFPAYQSLASELFKLKGKGENEMGLCYLPEGKEYYEFLVRESTGLSQSVPEMQSMTKQQITEDLIAMEEAFQKNASLTLDESTLFVSSPAEILDTLKTQISSSFPEIPEVSVEIKFVSSAMEKYLSPAFYMIPAIDNTSENVIYINQGQTVEGMNLFTTLAHEGYPGHLYQTVYFASQDPDPIRSILDFGGYVEGWATYTEMMSYYLAPISKTDATLLQKNTSIILGLYAYADMGIHYDGWSVNDMTDFFAIYGITDTAAIQEIYELIIGMPANYLKYYLGYVKFYKMKKEAAEELGEDFSQIKFHQAVLDVGPAPFDIVEKYVQEKLYRK